MDPLHLHRQVWSLGVTFYHMLFFRANLGKTTQSDFWNSECPWNISSYYEDQSGSVTWKLIVYWIRSGTLSRPLVFGNLNPCGRFTVLDGASLNSCTPTLSHASEDLGQGRNQQHESRYAVASRPPLYSLSTVLSPFFSSLTACSSALAILRNLDLVISGPIFRAIRTATAKCRNLRTYKRSRQTA